MVKIFRWGSEYYGGSSYNWHVGNNITFVCVYDKAIRTGHYLAKTYGVLHYDTKFLSGISFGVHRAYCF
jgi:hypothetical protein